MPTLNQLIRHGREEKRRTDRTRASDQCPQKQGEYLLRHKFAAFRFHLFFLLYILLVQLGIDPTFLLGKIRGLLLSRFRHFLFSCLGGSNEAAILLIVGALRMTSNDLFMEGSGSDGGSDSVAGYSSAGGGSSRGSGWTSFDLGVLAEPFPNEEGEEVAQPHPQNAPANPVASTGAAQRALPQAPAPAEVAHPAPNEVEEVSALRMELHALITDRVREESERGVGPLSTLFPELREVNSDTAHHIMGELELSTEINVNDLREWVERIREDKSLLKPLIKDYLPKR